MAGTNSRVLAFALLGCILLFLSTAAAAEAAQDINHDGRTDIKDIVLSQTRNLLKGDTNNDGRVDIFDLAAIGLAFGSSSSDPEWNPDLDVANTVDEIDIFDLAMVGRNFNIQDMEGPVLDPPINVTPKENNVSLGSSFTVNITINSPVGIYAFDLVFLFDPTIISVTSVAEGDFLNKDGASTSMEMCKSGYTQLCPKINNTAGRVNIANTRFGVQTEVTGNGTLARISFTALATGISNLDLASVTLVNAQLQVIAGVTTNNGTANVKCLSHNSTSCYNEDIYWFDSCGLREETKEECGSDACDSWGANYCKGGSVYHNKTCYDRGCAASAACFSNPWIDEQKVENCTYGCQDDQCIVPACTKNSDCGTDGWTGSPTCSNDDAYQNYRTYACNNPGTASAFCSNTDTPTLKQDCGSSYCEGWQANYCKGNDVYRKRNCYDKGCGSEACFSDLMVEEEKVSSCQYGCISGACANQPQKSQWASTASGEYYNDNWKTEFAVGVNDGSCNSWKTKTAWCRKTLTTNGAIELGFGEAVYASGIEVYFTGVSQGDFVIEKVELVKEDGSSETVWQGMNTNCRLDISFAAKSYLAKKVRITTKSGNWGCVDAAKLVGYAGLDSCTDECTQGQTRCSGDAKQICGNYDADLCLEWGGDVPCEYGCSNGNCNTIPSCSSDADCLSSQFCEFNIGTCSGNGFCSNKPEGCIGVVDPVCGCDGNVYSNTCIAHAAGVNIKNKGGCTQTTEQWASAADASSFYNDAWKSDFAKGANDGSCNTWKSPSAWCKKGVGGADSITLTFANNVYASGLEVYFTGASAADFGLAKVELQKPDSSWEAVWQGTNTNCMLEVAFAQRGYLTNKARITTKSGNWGCVDAARLTGYEGGSPPNCTENWQCSDWSVCSNNIQTRTCTDANNCGTQNNKPGTNRSCQVQQIIEQWTSAASGEYYNDNWKTEFAAGASDGSCNSWKTKTAWCKKTLSGNGAIELTFDKSVYATALEIHFTGTSAADFGLAKVELQEPDGSWEVAWQGTNANCVLQAAFAQKNYLTNRVRVTTKSGSWGCVDAAKLVGSE